MQILPSHRHIRGEEDHQLHFALAAAQSLHHSRSLLQVTVFGSMIPARQDVQSGNDSLRLLVSGDNQHDDLDCAILWIDQRLVTLIQSAHDRDGMGFKVAGKLDSIRSVHSKLQTSQRAKMK